MKKRKRETLERKKAARAAQQLPEWWVQGKSRVIEHFGAFLDDCLGDVHADEFTCEGGCYHYFEGECEGKGYQGREIFECLKDHKCDILLV